jgi:hypothetical protein
VFDLNEKINISRTIGLLARKAMVYQGIVFFAL